MKENPPLDNCVKKGKKYSREFPLDHECKFSVKCANKCKSAKWVCINSQMARCLDSLIVQHFCKTLRAKSNENKVGLYCLNHFVQYELYFNVSSVELKENKRISEISCASYSCCL